MFSKDGKTAKAFPSEFYVKTYAHRELSCFKKPAK